MDRRRLPAVAKRALMLLGDRCDLPLSREQADALALDIACFALAECQRVLDALAGREKPVTVLLTADASERGRRERVELMSYDRVDDDLTTAEA